jgi:hypothetical protein
VKPRTVRPAEALCQRELYLRELDGDRLLSATIDMSYVNVQYDMQNC